MKEIIYASEEALNKYWDSNGNKDIKGLINSCSYEILLSPDTNTKPDFNIPIEIEIPERND